MAFNSRVRALSCFIAAVLASIILSVPLQSQVNEVFPKPGIARGTGIPFQMPQFKPLIPAEDTARCLTPIITEYPDAPIRVDAMVVTRFRIATDSTPIDIEVIHCSDPGFGFEEAAIAAIRGARFQPSSGNSRRARLRWWYFPVEFPVWDILSRDSLLDVTDSLPPDQPAELLHYIAFGKYFTDSVGNNDLRLRVLVDSSGYTRRVQMIRGSNYPDVDTLITQIALRAEFKPARRGDRPVMSWFDWIYHLKAPRGSYLIPDSLPDQVDWAEPRVSLIHLGKKSLERDPRMSRQLNQLFWRGTVTEIVAVRLLRNHRGLFDSLLVGAATCQDEWIRSSSLDFAKKLHLKPPEYLNEHDSLWLQHQVKYLITEDGPEYALSEIPDCDTFLPFDKEPVVISPIVVPYPEGVHTRGFVGSVWVKLLIDREGWVRIAYSVKGTGLPVFDVTAVETAARARFRPATLERKPTPAWVTFKVEFDIPEEDPDSAFSGVLADTIEGPPKMIHYAVPYFPKLAQTAGMTGTVKITVTVLANGQVEYPRVAKSSGWMSLDESAVNAALDCRWKPAIRSGKAVIEDATYDVVFELKN